MPFICDNQCCANHLRISHIAAKEPYARKEVEGFLYDVKRYLYTNVNRTSDIWLCEICHSAVDMATKVIGS